MLREIKVVFDDGFWLQTSVAGTPAEIIAHYVGGQFNHDGVVHKGVEVEFLPDEIDTPVVPVVGMGATYGIGGDRYPYSIVKVVSHRKIHVRRDNARRIDNNGYGGEQVYEYTPNYRAGINVLTLRKNGRWILEGESLGAAGYTIGWRREYMDPHF